jgi:hypothetical protein
VIQDDVRHVLDSSVPEAKARRLLAQAAGPMKTPVERVRSGLKPSSSIPAFQDAKILCSGWIAPAAACLRAVEFPRHSFNIGSRR